jgi:ATP/ADP translocase
MKELSEGAEGRSLLERIFYLEAGELRRIVPFFLLYLTLFMGLTLADGLSLSLFVQRVGAAQLPACYALTAVLNLLGIAAYLWGMRSIGSVRIFQGILAGSALLYLLVWSVDRFVSDGGQWYALLFVGREMAYTLVLMHFGTYLLDFFGRDQLRRVLPIIYAGGRVGGIAGGIALQTLTPLGDPIDLVLLFVGLFSIGIVTLARFQPPGHLDETVVPDPLSPKSIEQSPLEAAATQSLAGFLTFVWKSPLMFWTTVTSVLFVACRWILNFQYSTLFESHFDDTASMARFLGQYTQVALLFSLLLQLLLVNRIVSWIGMKGAHFLYGAFVMGAFAGNLFWPTFPAAVFSRFIETELRFGLRNPIAQMMLNQFAKRVRVQVRAWSLGFLIPCSTLLTAVLLSRVPQMAGPGAVAWLGVLAGLSYLITSLGLYSSFTEARRSHQR